MKASLFNSNNNFSHKATFYLPCVDKFSINVNFVDKQFYCFTCIMNILKNLIFWMAIYPAKFTSLKGCKYFCITVIKVPYVKPSLSVGMKCVCFAFYSLVISLCSFVYLMVSRTHSVIACLQL